MPYSFAGRYYKITPDPKYPNDPNKYILKVYESWRYSEKEIEDFLLWLVVDQGYTSLNISRVKNEWMWHNVAYALGYKKESSRRVDVFFNSSDPNPFRAFIFDTFCFWG